MKPYILFLLLLSLSACASSRVNVDLESCQDRGKIDGIRVGSCEPVKVVK